MRRRRVRPDASCFTNPTTHNEIINACTTAQKIYKHPNAAAARAPTARCRRCRNSSASRWTRDRGCRSRSVRSSRRSAGRPTLDTFVQVDAVPYSQHSLDEVDPGGSGTPLERGDDLDPARGSSRDRGDARRLLRGARARRQHGQRARRRGSSRPPGRLAASAMHERDPLVQRARGSDVDPVRRAGADNARYRDFVEQPTFLRALFPGDDRCRRAARDGAYGFVRWSVSAMNGAPVGDAQWQGRDPVSSYDLMGRLGTDVPLPHRGRFVAGVSALTGTGLHPGTPPTKDSLAVGRREHGRHRPDHRAEDDARQPGRAVADVHARRARSRRDVALVPLRDSARHACSSRARSRRTSIAAWSTPIRSHARATFASSASRSALVQDARADARSPACATIATTRIAMRPKREGVTTVYTHEVFSTLSLMAAATWKTARLTVEYDHVDESVRPLRQRRADDAARGSRDAARPGGVLMRRAWSLIACSPPATARRPIRATAPRSQLDGAQFRAGRVSRGDRRTGDPSSSSVEPSRRSRSARSASDSHAVLDPSARAAIVGIVGQPTARGSSSPGRPDIDTPGQPTATARFGLDRGCRRRGRSRSLLAATDAMARSASRRASSSSADAEPTARRRSGRRPRVGARPRISISTSSIRLGGEAWSDKPNTLPAADAGRPGRSRSRISSDGHPRSRRQCVAVTSTIRRAST